MLPEGPREPFRRPVAIAARHGLDPAAHPDRAKALLGETAWHGLRRDFDAPAPDLGELESVVAAIETL